MTIGVYVAGVGILGPGLNGWSQSAAVLAGREAYRAAATELPAPALLPAAERRRVGRVVKLALAVALEATTAAAADPKQLASVFSSSGGDGHICHEICRALAAPVREVSPTRFSNSVHNAAAGYWGIATGAMSESNVLCAYDASFAAGLLEAMMQTTVDARPVLLVAFDTEYPQPLHAKRPIPDAFGIAMVLTPQATVGSIARIEAALRIAPIAPMEPPVLEGLRRAIPAARGLPLLQCLARHEAGEVLLEYLDPTHLAVRVQPCH